MNCPEMCIEAAALTKQFSPFEQHLLGRATQLLAQHSIDPNQGKHLHRAVVRACQQVQPIQWTAGARPDTDQDEDYWVVIRHVSSGDTFVELSRYWGSVKAWSMDRHRFAVLAYSKAETPAVPAAYLTSPGQ